MDVADGKFTVRDLYFKLQENTLDTSLSIQRGEVWSREKQSLFVSSCITRYVIPNLYVVRSEDSRDLLEYLGMSCEGGKEYVFDGNQRLFSCKKFKEGKLVLKGVPKLVIWDTGKVTEFDSSLQYPSKCDIVSIDGMTYQNLPDAIRIAFDTCILTLTYVSKATCKELLNLFSRLNNGVALTTIESLLPKALAIKQIQQLASHKVFDMILSEHQRESHRDAEIIINIHNMLYSDAPCFSRKNLTSYVSTAVFTDENVDRIRVNLDGAYNALNVIRFTSPSVFKKLKRKIHFLSLVYLVDKNQDGYTGSTELKMIALLQSQETSVSELYNKYTRGDTGSCTAIRARCKVLDEILMQ